MKTYIVDTAEIERRLLASVREEVAFDGIAGEDPHRRYAAHLFGVAYMDVTHEQRMAAKARCFGEIYGRKGKVV